MAELAQAQATLKDTLDKVAALEAQFNEANAKKVCQLCLLSYAEHRGGAHPHW